MSSIHRNALRNRKLYIEVELRNITIALWKNETYRVASILAKSQASSLNVFLCFIVCFQPSFYLVHAVRLV